ncbi:hypothetical protein M6B38_312060 [Iris pallida]|uniref:Uncharacterized protein n=1 Tax=Iris pallida TaxID=29817 RepID=A0AAX6HHI3_IRIPA|nr:hypothetical protein M6B38_312060 [Iris pallida]
MIIRLYFKYFEHVFSTLFQSFKIFFINCFVVCLSLFRLGVTLAIFINIV